MTQGVLRYLPEQFKKNFYNNVEAFREAWEDENKTRSSIRRKELSLVCSVEKTSEKISLLKQEMRYWISIKNCVFHYNSKRLNSYAHCTIAIPF